MSVPQRLSRAGRFAAALLGLALVCAVVGQAQSESSSGEQANSSAIGNLMSGQGFWNQGTSHDAQIVRFPVFFSPSPPPLNLVAKRANANDASGYAPASELSAYVNEPFYSALAARIFRNELSGRTREALHRYHDEKNLLQHNLRTELAYILTQPPAARGPLLAALAQKMDPPILALEDRADAFRADLFKSDYAWVAARKPRLTDTARRANDPLEIAHAMPGAAAFQRGLTPAQRTLAREIAIEVMSGGGSVTEAVAAQPYVFFSPGPSRVMFPDELPPDIAAKLAAYQTKKSALRKELYDAIYREDGAWLGMIRTLRLESLAGKQAPEFTALETLAEEIRRGLPPMPAPHPSRPLVPLPSTLIERIRALHERQVADQHEIDRQLEQLRASDKEVNLLTGLNAEGRYELRSLYRSRTGGSKDYQRAKARIEDLLAGYDRSDLALSAAREAIRHEIARQLQTEDRARIDIALADGVRLALEQETLAAMQDYHIALLEPGLSPAERRLLFDGAVEDLALPLPRGVLQTQQRLDQSTARLDR